MSVLFAGYTYIRDSYRSTFEYYPEKDKLYFLLPYEWRARGGKVVFRSEDGKNLIRTRTLFYHSRYPLIGGLLKGWMPAFPLYAWKLKKENGLKLVFSFSEPISLTTLYNVVWSKLFGLQAVIFTWENIAKNLEFRGVKGLIRKIIVILNLYLADGLICGNHKGQMIYGKLSKKPMAVIPPFGLDSELFKKVMAEKSFNGHALDGNVVFTFAGAIAPRKGIPGLINAFERLIQTAPHARLILVGNDETGGEVDRVIEKRGLKEYVLRKDWLDHNQLRELLSISDVFVYPSIPYGGWEEQFGYSMAEASLTELPVISTRSGSIEDVVVNNKTGILIEPGNEEELYRAMLKLAQDKELRKKMGQDGRQYVINNFGQKTVAVKFYNFFKLLK